MVAPRQLPAMLTVSTVADRLHPTVSLYVQYTSRDASNHYVQFCCAWWHSYHMRLPVALATLLAAAKPPPQPTSVPSEQLHQLRQEEHQLQKHTTRCASTQIVSD